MCSGLIEAMERAIQEVRQWQQKLVQIFKRLCVLPKLMIGECPVETRDHLIRIRLQATREVMNRSIQLS